MEDDLKTILEYILTDHVLTRARAIRLGRLTEESKRTGVPIDLERVPTLDNFVGDVLDELAAHRGRIIATLRT